MVRTKADAGSTKVCAAKAPRKMLSSGASSSNASPSRSGSSKDRYSGGNSYNPQPIPNWQKGISAFFKPQASPNKDSSDGSSTSISTTTSSESSIPCTAAGNSKESCPSTTL